MNSEHMADDDAASETSSLSSVQSPQTSSLDEIRVTTRAPAAAASAFAEGVVASSTSATPAPAHAIPTPTPADSTAKPKRARKPREPKVEGKDEKAKDKKPRRPREPKVKAEDGSAPAPRKRQKKEPAAIAPDASASGPRQSTLTGLVTQYPQPAASTTAPPPHPQHILASQPLQRPNQPDILIRDSLPPASKPPTPRPYSSGQNFDPIRGSILGAAPPRPPTKQSSGEQSAPPSADTFARPSGPPPAPTRHTNDGAMDVDGPVCEAPMKTQPSKSSSSAPTPQVQPKEKKAASPKPAGTGLLASNNLFGGPGAKQESEIRGPNIEIRISLNRDGGNTVNIAQEIFKKYGQDAINPRAAAHRAKLLQVAAAQNKLEGGFADDMSVDLMSDMDGDSNIEMGGMDDEGKSATGADDAKPRKRRRKVEEYDKDDDFIDDTELAWQEKAAVAKDGFFVYSGKLVPEGTTANVESAAPSGRGRGGGRGRGRGRGGTTAASSAITTATEKVRDPNAPTRGRGSRGGKIPGAPRKPRITKAEKEKLEAEKAQRERMMNTPAGTSATPMSTTNSATPASLVQQQPPPQQPALGTQHHVYSNGTTGQQGVQV
ncbi:hypothetical protein CBER1_00159 [Cercospora berteroae]|uniref:Hpc2-related domain-containing protein n=1 Tax=Cercospora berteroae TaxID=357750 RepID=A0A2S6CDJ5_9PEZI|nr:hypothetical protein CBER1_00159 [Cercospora berteroae]